MLSDSPSAVEGVPVDSDRLSKLFVEYREGLLRFVVGVVRDREAAKDVVQDVFAKAVESASEVNPQAMKSWLYRVAFHEAISYKRRVQIDQSSKPHVAKPAHEGSEKPDESLVRNEVIEEVREVLQKLPLNQQHVVRLRIYEQKTFAQIAEETGSPLGTVLTHMRRALETLRQKLHLKR